MKLSVFILMIPIFLQAQVTIDGATFIQRAIDNNVTEERQREKVRLSMVEKVDFRTETRDFELEKQEYVIRVTPSSPATIKAQRALEKQMNEYVDFDKHENTCDQIKEANVDWLNLYVNSIQEENHKVLYSILQDKSKVLEKMQNAHDFDLNEMLDLESDKSKINFRIEEYTMGQIEIIEKYSFDNAVFDFSNFVDPNEIKVILESDQINPEINPEDKYEQEKILKEIDLEVAEKKQIVDFAQVKYQGPHNNIFDERVSLGLAFTLNTSGNKNLKIRELELEHERNEAQIRRELGQKNLDLKIQKRKILSDLKLFFKYQNIHTQERDKLIRLSDQIAKERGVNPLILLDIQERLTLIKVDELELKENILEDYLDYLENKNELCSTDKNGLASSN